MNKKILVIISTIAIAVVVLGGIWLWYVRETGGRLLASGTIEATEVVVSSQVTGRVVELLVDEGGLVKQGDVLAKLETRELTASLKSARARYQLAKDDYARNKKLYADKMISSRQFETVKSAFQVASAGLDLAKIQYDNAEIEAPIAGTVMVKAIEAGELANIGTPIVTLADLASLNLMVYLPEDQVGKVNLGDIVDVSVDSFPDEKFPGKVIYISQKAEFTPKSIQTKDERVTQVFGVKIDIANSERKLKPGMPADAEF